MSLDTELEDWKRDWQAKAEVPADLRRKVERQSRRLKISLAGDVLVTVAIGGGDAGPGGAIAAAGYGVAGGGHVDLHRGRLGIPVVDYTRAVVPQGRQHCGICGFVGEAVPGADEGVGVRRGAFRLRDGLLPGMDLPA